MNVCVYLHCALCRFVFECLSGVRQQGISGAVLADGMGLGMSAAGMTVMLAASWWLHAMQQPEAEHGTLLCRRLSTPHVRPLSPCAGKTFQTIASLYCLLTKGVFGQPTCKKPLILCPTSLVQVCTDVSTPAAAGHARQ